MKTDSHKYLEVTIPLDPFSEENAEIVEAMVSELPFNSFMAEDGCLKCYIQETDYDHAALSEALEGLPFCGTAEAKPLEARNWNAEWEQNGFTPIVVDDAVTVAPVGADAATEYKIFLDPQMAFGTGHHHTTFMMMQTMLASVDVIRGRSVVDLGCGTAVLAILAAQFGASDVLAIDIDAVAARSAQENARMNGVQDIVVTECGDASALVPCDVLLANIHRNIIIGDIDRYAAALRTGGLLMLSGFYVSDIADVCSAASDAGFALEQTREREGWACLRLRRL